MKDKIILRCPNCGLEISQIRANCPRCNTSLKDQLVCTGNCKKCNIHR